MELSWRTEKRTDKGKRAAHLQNSILDSCFYVNPLRIGQDHTRGIKQVDRKTSRVLELHSLNNTEAIRSPIQV